MTKKPTKNSINLYLASLATHIKFFTEAAQQLNVPEEQIRLHDLSKRSDEELFAYTRKFIDGVKDREEFGCAWLHHIHHNPHHWQHWILNTEDNALMLEMPAAYVREMVADWMGAQKVQTGNFEMSKWLEINLSQIKLHASSLSVLERILVDEGGYDEWLVQEWL